MGFTKQALGSLMSLGLTRTFIYFDFVWYDSSTYAVFFKKNVQDCFVMCTTQVKTCLLC